MDIENEADWGQIPAPIRAVVVAKLRERIAKTVTRRVVAEAKKTSMLAHLNQMLEEMLGELTSEQQEGAREQLASLIGPMRHALDAEVALHVGMLDALDEAIFVLEGTVVDPLGWACIAEPFQTLICNHLQICSIKNANDIAHAHANVHSREALGSVAVMSGTISDSPGMGIGMVRGMNAAFDANEYIDRAIVSAYTAAVEKLYGLMKKSDPEAS